MSAPPRVRGWRSIMQAFGTPSAGTMCLLGFGSGLPFLLIGYTLSIWLREFGLTLGAIGLLSYVTFFYVFKFVWAPFLDHWKAPLLGRWLGRRRGWLVLAIAVLIAALAGMAVVGPGRLELFVSLAALAGFAGATQDTMVDAYRIEIAPQEAQAALAATYTLGYRVGLILSGAGALYIAAFSSWRMAYLCMAAALLIPLGTALVAREPEARHLRPLGLGQSITGPFVDFFRRHGVAVAIVVLVFVGLYKLPDQMLGVMAGPFYVDSGFSKDQIATVSKLYGVWIGLAGAFLGGVSVATLGLKRSLFIAALGVALSNLLYVLMATHPGQTWAFVAAISGDNSTLGFAGVVLVAFLSSLTSLEFTATQYALLSSFSNLPGKLVGGMSGFMVERWGYPAFFVFSTLSVVPTVILLVWLGRRLKELLPHGEAA